MSVEITISHGMKKYGQTTVIPDLSLDIRNGELFYAAGAFRLREDNTAPDDCRFQQY